MQKLWLSALALAVGAPALAQQNDDGLALGVGTGYFNNPYIGYSNRFAVLPVINFNSRYFYADGLSAGARLLQNDDQSQEVLLGVSYLGNEFKPNKSDDQRLKRLDKRRSSLMADLSYHLYTPYGNFESRVSHDLLGRNKGTLLNAQYSYFWEITPQFTLKPEIGINYADRKFNQYYYGVSAEESLRSGLPQYRAKAGVQPYIGLGASYQLTQNIEIFAGVRFEKLSRHIRHSPMVDDKYGSEGALGVMYRF